MPHPEGPIEVSYELKKGKLHAIVLLPGNMDGVFEYKGRTIRLKPGRIFCEPLILFA